MTNEYFQRGFAYNNSLKSAVACIASTTAVACIKTNRKYVGYEKEETYYNVCIERINNAIEDATQADIVETKKEEGELVEQGVNDNSST